MSTDPHPFIELTGASGVAYRFRYTELDHAPSLSGAFALLRSSPEGWVIASLGAADKLSAVKARTPPDTALYVRLNVSRMAWQAELDDLSAAHPGVALFVLPA